MTAAGVCAEAARAQVRVQSIRHRKPACAQRALVSFRPKLVSDPDFDASAGLLAGAAKAVVLFVIHQQWSRRRSS